MLSKHHYGFRAKVSTEFAIYDIVECISENMDQKILTCAVFLDLSKAFDTVDHSVLLWKKEHYYAFKGSHYNFLKIIYIGENNMQ